MFWKKPKATKPDQPVMNAIARIKEEKALIDDADFTDNFRVNKDVLIELAPRDKSAEPEFQRDFFTLAENIKSLDHPAILRLYSYGEEDGRLCRMWENPRLFSAAALRPENSPERRHQLALAVEGFQLLHKMGISLEKCSPTSLSFHLRDKRMFIARYPFTQDGTPRSSGHIPNFMVYACHSDPKALGERSFLLQLGFFMSFCLVGDFPYNAPPLLSERSGVPVVRKELPLAPSLREVLDRLTEFDPEANYPDVTSGLEELRAALQP